MHLGPHHHHQSSHACQHAGQATKLSRSFALAVAINLLLVGGEFIGGFVSGSMALLADAGHNLSDVAGLLLAWGAHWLRGWSSRGRWTYGFRGFTILAANLNGLLLVVAIFGISFESLRRFWYPSEIAEIPVLIVALVAAGLNLASAQLLSQGGGDLNVRGAYLHMMADAAVSMAVVVGAALMIATGWSWVDPAISLGICLVLVFGTWNILHESTTMLMNAAPQAMALDEISSFLQSLPGVDAVMDLHVWSVSTTDVLLTARIHCPDTAGERQDELLSEIHEGLEHEFGIAHSTIEVVRGAEHSASCALEG